ncbi:MAG: NAD(P)/FAD-dependent oxidoreductase [Nitrososphaeraceae archaeon]
MHDSDVLINGAGPAGCAAAIFCAQKKLSVTLIDSEKEFSQKPGESLHPGILSLFKELGIEKDFLSAGFLKHNGNWIKWDNSIKRFEKFGNNDSEMWKGFQAWRPLFDEILLKRCQNLGINIIRGCKSLKPIISNKQITGLFTTEGIFKSSFLIDATGNTNWLARKLNLKIQRFSPVLVAYYGYVKGECLTRDKEPLILADKEGWIWTAKIKPQVYQWVRLFFRNIQSKKKVLKPKEFQDLTTLTSRGSDVTWRIVSNPANNGYFIVGDAAFVLDPISSHGIIKAIMSGMMSGYLISQINNNNITKDNAISYYNNWIFKWFNGDMQNIKKLYSKHPFPPSWI